MKNYKYDAFISYRHCDLDKFVAENLHKILESYELPKNLKQQLNIEGKSIKRVFRDQEELPLASNLEDPIIDALENSKYLIVICSPRLKESLWCKKEIETFKKLRGRKNIFCVLVEGEPKDSFPEEVLYDEVVNSKGKKEKKLVEPLAADVRAQSKREVLKKIKEEKLRLIAGMFSLNYDDLKQRHKIRQQKRMVQTIMIVSVFLFLFALYTSIMLIKINSQQKTLKRHQAVSLSNKSKTYLKKDYRYDAVKTSYQALTKFKGVKMPYTPQAEYALSESLGVYDTGTSYKAISEIKTKGVVNYIKSSSDNKYAAVYDGSEEINIFNSKTLDKISTYSVSGISYYESSFDFIGKDILAFINEKGNISLVNVKTGKLIKEIKDKNTCRTLKGDSNGNYLVYTTDNKVYIYNTKNNKTMNSISTKKDFVKDMYFSSDGKYIFVADSKSELDKQEYMTMHVIKASNAKEINSVEFKAGYLSGVVTKEDNAYFLLNNMIDINYDMLIVSYNYIDGEKNWSKTYEKRWGKFIKKSYPIDIDHLAIVNYDTVSILDMEDGDVIETFNSKSEIINIYSNLNKEMYLVFTDNGHVNFIDMESKNNIEYSGRFEFKLSNYNKVINSSNGFLLVPKNDNRVILYEKKPTSTMKKVKIKNPNIKDKSLSLKEQEKAIKKYNIKNKELINRIFYDNEKKVMFVNYTNKDLSIYNTNNKKLIKKLNNIGIIKYYYGKDKYDRIYVGDASESYILNEKYDKVGHITGLVKITKDKAIINNSNGYYELKIYNLKELLKEAKKYLK